MASQDSQPSSQELVVAPSPPSSQELVVAALQTQIALMTPQESNTLTYQVSLQTPAEVANGVAILQQLLATYQHAAAVQRCVKDVHFDRDVPRADSVYLHAANHDADGVLVVTNPGEGGLTIEQIVNADFLIVSDDPVTRDPRNFTIVPSINIRLTGPTASQPTKAIFTSGSRYYMSDGYSVRHCGKIQSIDEMWAAH